MPARPPTVAILTQGCKLNQADSEKLARELSAHGLQATGRPEAQASFVVINTCSVTNAAEAKARNLVRLAHKVAPAAQVIVTGCATEAAAKALPAPAAGLTIPSPNKGAIAGHILSQFGQLNGGSTPQSAVLVTTGLRTRAFVKIQEGCNELCSFCIVPYRRGRERSIPIDQVVEEVLKREADGVNEVVLTGTQLGNYGRDFGWKHSGPLPLLETLLARTRIPRIRLSSLQPQDISPPLVELWKNSRLCPHFHIPLQSGSDTVLSRMRRRYTSGQFLHTLALLRKHLPQAAITTDVIAGFPGESDEDFMETFRVAREASFAAIHTFPYSRRSGTAAGRMKDQVSDKDKRARLQQLLEIARNSTETFRRLFLGLTLPVLWEQRRAGQWHGLTGNYLRVYTSANADLSNRLLPVRLVSLAPDGVEGIPVLEDAP